MTTQEDLWDKQLELLSRELSILPDKPEETIETTLRALWCKSCGESFSAETVVNKTELPDLSLEETEELNRLIRQRLSGTPLAHLTGRQYFLGVDLKVGSDALIPRKETQLLGETALGLLQEIASKNEKPIYIDVCTGAGNLPVALALQIPGLLAYAADISAAAMQLAQQNIELFDLAERVTAMEGDLFEPFESDEFYEKVDLITCNPPYISTAKVAEMHSEISLYEPTLAFDGGPFGVRILRRLISETPRFLKPGGWLAFEVGLGQGEKLIKQLEKKSDYSKVHPIYDSQGSIRAITAQK